MSSIPNSATSQNINTVHDATQKTYDTFVEIKVDGTSVTTGKCPSNATYKDSLGLDKMALVKQSTLSEGGGSGTSLKFEPVIMNIIASPMTQELRIANIKDLDCAFKFVRIDTKGKELIELEVLKGKVILVNDLDTEKGHDPMVDVYIKLVHFAYRVYVDGSPSEWEYNFDDGGMKS